MQWQLGTLASDQQTDTRDVSEPAKIQIHQTHILYFKPVSFEFGFVTQSHLVQFN